MKITGYKLDKYIQQLDRAIGDANYPKGDDLMGMSILQIETDEDITGIAPGGNDAVEDLFLLGFDSGETRERLLAGAPALRRDAWTANYWSFLAQRVSSVSLSPLLIPNFRARR